MSEEGPRQKMGEWACINVCHLSIV